MKGDFSRDTFNAKKHFSRVLQQQGRVQLDADTNEQTEILLHYLRTLAADLIGSYAGPEGSDGFKIALMEDEKDLSIGEGRYYVDGILCENEIDTKYTEQESFEKDTKLPDTPYLVYLDVWERHITALEDDEIREKALGGPDTATRTKVIWQVKMDDGSKDDGDGSFTLNLDQSNIYENWESWKERWQPVNRGRLKARVKPSENSTEPCLTAPDARYRGQENQLYRIEIHHSGTASATETNDGDQATFKWSRDNGAIVTGCTKNGKKLTVDSSRGFTAPGWVELTGKALELRGEPGVLAEIAQIEGNVLTLKTNPVLPQGIDEESPLWVRRWESGSILVTESSDNTGWIGLENGIEIQFMPVGGDNPPSHRYRTGDYWLIPARVATGEIEWPESDVQGVPPFGIEHHYAPLAVIGKDDSKLEDLRCKFEPQWICSDKNGITPSLPDS